MHAPFGGVAMYPHSLHIDSIAWVHRLMEWLHPGYPLASSAFLVPVIIGALAGLPAFAIGRALAGDIGGLFAALLSALNPLFLLRSIGSDNDVWNVVLPLALIWAAIRTTTARSVFGQAALRSDWPVGMALHFETWNGWLFTYAVVVVGLWRTCWSRCCYRRAGRRSGVAATSWARAQAATRCLFCHATHCRWGAGVDPASYGDAASGSEVFHARRCRSGVAAAMAGSVRDSR